MDELRVMNKVGNWTARTTEGGSRDGEEQIETVFVEFKYKWQNLGLGELRVIKKTVHQIFLYSFHPYKI